MSKGWIIGAIIICVGIAAGIYWLGNVKEIESGNEVTYASYLEFEKDLHFINGRFDIGRASPGDTIKIYDTIYSIEYDQGNDTTRIKFVSCVSDPKYEGTTVLFESDLTNEFSAGDKAIVIYKITSKNGNDWISSKSLQHQ